MGRYLTRDLKLYNKIIKGSPIMLNKTKLLYDTKTLDLVLQVSLKNFSDRDIKSVCLIGKFYNNEGKLLKDKEKIVIKEKIKKYEEFSTNEPILIKEENVFNILLIVYSVEFDDGSTWINKGKKDGVDLLEKIYIEDKTLRNAFKWKDIQVSLNNYPVFTDEYYICSCGKVHMNDTVLCDGCNIEREELVKVFNNRYIKRVIKEYKKSSNIIEDEVERDFELPRDYSSESGINFLKILLLVSGIIILVYVIYSLVEKVLF